MFWPLKGLDHTPWRLAARSSGSAKRRAMATACWAYIIACWCSPVTPNILAKPPKAFALRRLSSAPSPRSTSSSRRTAGAPGKPTSVASFPSSSPARTKLSVAPSVRAMSAARSNVSWAATSSPAFHCASPSDNNNVQRCASSTGS